MLIYPKYHGSFYDKYLVKFVDSIPKKERVIILTWNSQLNLKFKRQVQIILNRELEYWSKSNDYKEYDRALKIAKENNMFHLHFLRVNYESFYAVATNNPDFNLFKITLGIFGQREIYETRVRQSLMKSLMESKAISAAVCHSISNQLVPPGRLKISDKIVLASDPIYDDVQSYQSIRIKSKSHLLRFNFFGLPHYGKGLQIFSDAVDLLNSPSAQVARFKACGNISRANTVFSLSELLDVTDDFLTEAQVLELLRNTDYLVLPYRRTYTEVTSGVLVQAALSHTPVIVPDIYPFKDVVEEYSLGFVFKCEDAADLASVIASILSDPKRLDYRFEDFLADQDSWIDIVNKLN